jgi:sulfur-oxidizing protein SoxY
MSKPWPERALTRRALLWAAPALTVAGGVVRPGKCRAAAKESEADENELIRRLIGETATESTRVRLEIPPVFANGHSVPMTLSVDSPMNETDYVRQVLILAPQNPILTVASFQFTPQSGRAAVSTRIRLAETQNVLAVAQMSGGAALMARAWVEVEENGCPTN